MPWGASLDAHYRELGEQLSGLTDLAVDANGPAFFSAIGIVASSAPSLTRLTFTTPSATDLALPPICSASLKSIAGEYSLPYPHAGPQPVILTFLPGCTHLRDVHVQFRSEPYEVASVKFHCHCISQRCIVPFVGHTVELYDGVPSDRRCILEEVGVRFLPTQASPQGVQPYTVLFACHAAGPEQAPKWDHLVMPGVL